MQKVGRAVAALLVCCAAMLAMLVGGTPAMASSSCYGDYCSGMDPASTVAVDGRSCSDGAFTVAAIDLLTWRLNAAGSSEGYWANVGKLELRWSPRCQTNWARLSTTESTSIQTLGVTQSTGYNQQYKTNGNAGNTGAGVFWTNMIYSPVAACRAWTWGGNFQNSSTAWV